MSPRIRIGAVLLFLAAPGLTGCETPTSKGGPADAPAPKAERPAARPDVVALIEKLGSEDKKEREAAGAALKRMGRPAVPALVEALRDKNSSLRGEAAQVLGWIGADAKEAVPALARALKDVDYVSVLAAGALCKIGPAAKDAVPSLIKALEDEYEELRTSAACALSAVGAPAAEKAVPVLIRRLRDDCPSVREAAAGALGTIGRGQEETVPALVKALRDDDRRVRYVAAWWLGEIGEAAKAVAPALVRALKEARAVRWLLIHQDNPDWGEKYGHESIVCKNCIIALGKIGPASKEVLPALVRTFELEEADWETCGVATKALAKIGKPSVPSLVEALRDGSSWVRWQVAVTLGEIGPEAEEAVPALVKALMREETDMRPGIGRRHWYARKAAVEALGKIGPVAVPALVEALQHKGSALRHAAAEALAGIGPRAKGAIPGLERALRDEAKHVREAAAEALRKINVGADESVPATAP
ncbi:MAG: HEAT repeat domain-containing protein [Planctomycetota bacterium]|jgi:HEAT repeat protein